MHVSQIMRQLHRILIQMIVNPTSHFACLYAWDFEAAADLCLACKALTFQAERAGGLQLVPDTQYVPRCRLDPQSQVFGG